MNHKIKCLSRSVLLTLNLVFISIFAHAAETTHINVRSAYPQGNYSAFPTFISADGRYVFFHRVSFTDMGDPNLNDDFVYDRLIGKTTSVNIPSVASYFVYYNVISADGRYVAYTSAAENLVAGDKNGHLDVFVHDRSTGKTTLISRSSLKKQGNNDSFHSSMSADGRYVAFSSEADNLVSGDTNGVSDAFIRNRMTGKTTRISVSSAGAQANGASRASLMSADGRYLVFYSSANNLAPGKTHRISNPYCPADIFVHDRVTGKTTREISQPGAGDNYYYCSDVTDINVDGRYLVFHSMASNIVPRDTNYQDDLFVRDRLTGKTTRVSVSSTGEQQVDYGISDYSEGNPTISADGRYVAFSSWATNLVPDDTNGFPPYNMCPDVFVHDRATGKTSRISVSSSGIQGNDFSGGGLISADGRYVAFWSDADNLVTGAKVSTSDVFVRDRLLDKNHTADLQISLIAKPISIKKGQTAKYTFLINNKGPDTADQVALTNIISNGAVTGIKLSQGSCSKAAVNVCRLGKLPNGKSAKIEIHIKVDANPLTQQISVNAAPKDKLPGNNSIKIRTLITSP